MTDILHKHYFSKITTNIFGVFINFINVSLISRSLGPGLYGHYEFLISFFQEIIVFFDSILTTAFYHKICAKKNDLGLLILYAKILCAIFFVVLVTLFCCFKFGIADLFWPGQDFFYILFAFIICFAGWISEIIRKILDAFGCTVESEYSLLICRLVGALIVTLLFYYNFLTFGIIFLKEFFVFLTSTIFFIFIAYRFWKKSLKNSSYRTPQKNLIFEILDYSSPLILYAIFGLFCNILDRWLLQNFYGSEQQAYYSISLRISSFSLLFTLAMTQLMMREFSVAFTLNNISKVRRLFVKYLPLFYLAAAFFGVFLFAESKNILLIISGEKYLNGNEILSVIALYPIHQTYGQINGALLLSAGKSRIYSRLGLITMFFGFIISLYLLLPKEFGGLSLGGLGLAYKILALQFLSVNIQLFINTKALKLSFFKYLVQQFLVLLVLFVCIYFSKFITSNFVQTPAFEIFIHGIIYLILFLTFIFFIPKHLGLKRSDMKYFANFFKNSHIAK
jgi:O-antigen/teichoic acid export membrane protein